MFIEILIVAAIIGLLFIGPRFENAWVAIAVYGGVIVGMILALWYSGRLSSGIAGFLLGGSGGGKVKETYDLAEKYEVEHRYEDAINVYRRAFEKDKKNPTPRMRLADLYYRLGDYDNCLTYMQEALRLSQTMSDSERCSLMNRIADVHLQHKHDPASAATILKQIIKEFPNSKHALFARERIAEMKKNA
ncbi:MAG: tetratricopeptide repeat protein [Candidatus Abyssobacteria bacterium SURF_17]|jgi:tetratricopeptide (TPR) repeat protein|uniref:Tetratricopeptide repeat protein n=1 Tax=Candidatus Abyssobacteria bacterium SURF_17 TaxID=2093361 RepID=A0A419EQS8_9BACT|nr:MAG: tetratricopeptide repeat protein [Candidatus Abyssubacteria bacterium SURF_17]